MPILSMGTSASDSTIPPGMEGPELLAHLEKTQPVAAAGIKSIYAGDESAAGRKLQTLLPLTSLVFPGFTQQSYDAKRKMRVDLNSSAPNSMGGILANGKSAFGHLANLSDKYIDLHNYSGPDVPGGAWVGEAGNVIGNVLFPKPEMRGKIAGAETNALKYGQESTKFYAGTGGGEGERMAALKGNNPRYTTSAGLAGFLQAEKELMLERLHQKEGQVREALGESWLREHPIMTDELSATIKKIDANIAKLRGDAPEAAATTAATPPAATGAPTPTPGAFVYDPATGTMTAR